MPNIKVDTANMDEWEDKLALEEENEPPRTGVHVSDLVNCIRQPVLMQKYMPEWDMNTLIMFKFGRAFETAVFKSLLPGSTREVEVIEEGIEGHIDFGIGEAGSDDLDYETKLTWRYQKEDPNELFEGDYYYVLEQAGTYAIMRRRRECRIALLYVNPPPPQLEVLRVEWTAKEQGELWDIMRRRRDYYLEGLAGKRLPKRTPLKKLCLRCPVNRVCYEVEPD
tara:strand:- start:7300 stop:7968 length:669 start_codon:yes stop_codon:yes gene_type:complete